MITQVSLKAALLRERRVAVEGLRVPGSKRLRLLQLYR